MRYKWILLIKNGGVTLKDASMTNDEIRGARLDNYTIIKEGDDVLPEMAVLGQGGSVCWVSVETKE